MRKKLERITMSKHVLYVENVNGNRFIEAILNKSRKYEWYWLHPYAKCEIGEFDSFLEAENALCKYYGYENVTEIRV